MQKEAICSTTSLQIGLNEAKIRKSTYLRNLPQVCSQAESRLRNLPQVIPERNHVCGTFRKHNKI